MEDSLKNFKFKTTHNDLYLVEQRGRLELRGRDKSVQSIVDLAAPHRLELENLRYLVSVLLFIPPPRRILMLGTGAGSLLHFLRHHYPQARLTALDIDRELVDEMRRREVLPAPDEHLEYIFADATDYIWKADQGFDLIVIDLFFGAQTPGWLLRNDCSQRLRNLLVKPAALAFNLLVDSDHDFQRFYRDLQALFQSRTLSLPVPGLENKLVFGVLDDARENTLSDQLQRASELSEKLDIDLMPMLSLIYNTNPVGNGLL